MTIVTIVTLFFFSDDGKYKINDVSRVWERARKIKCRHDHEDLSRVHVFVETFKSVSDIEFYLK